MNGKPRIVNVVATGRFSCELDIEKLSQTLNCIERVYEPEIYPALLVEVGKKRYHITLYINGKYIICGAKSFSRSFHELLVNEEISWTLIFEKNSLGCHNLMC